MNSQRPDSASELTLLVREWSDPFQDAPSELPRKEDELLEFADVVFIGGENRLVPLYPIRRRSGRNSLLA